MNVDDKRLAMLVEDQSEDQELWYPVQRLREAGTAVTIVGPEAGKTCKPKHGYPAKSDKPASEVASDDLDGLIIPGGYPPDRIRRNELMVALVRDARLSANSHRGLRRGLPSRRGRRTRASRTITIGQCL